ncbi:hypothetical protein ONE63_010787 [Megalurothrips usitatus]|uniref:RecQ-mediated genome instability protein 2 n=1 Tax=Megalurothrips usitatus TaxID=439358 RepID=A0AAV7XKY4_9NEOP|nr:hypothetical protein ONE63_010787 [Megalurothrips usitatus]
MSLEAKVVPLDSPLKMMIGDLKRVAGNKSQAHPWVIKFLADSTNNCPTIVEFSQIWLQGSVKTSMNDSDSIVLTDGSGDVKVTKCARVPGDRSWIKAGAYCGIFACVKKLSLSSPEVEAIKVMDLCEMKNDAQNMWPSEVQELIHFLRGSITFQL